MLQDQFNSPLPINSPPQFLQTQSVYLPNNSYSHSNPRPAQNITKENRLELANSQQQVLLGLADNTQLKQSAQNGVNSLRGSNEGINKSAFVSGRTSKYNNKYSFKRHSAVNKTKLTSTFEYVGVPNDANASLRKSQDLFATQELAQYKALLLQHQAALKKIRDFAYSRRSQELQSSTQRSSQSIKNINDLTEIYNLTLVGNHSHAKYLQFLQQKIATIQNSSVVQQVIQIPHNNIVSNAQQLNVQRTNTQIVQVVPQTVTVVNQPRLVPVEMPKEPRPQTTNTVIVQKKTIVSPNPTASVQQTYQSSSYHYESKPKVQVAKQTGYGYQSFNYQSKYRQEATSNQYTETGKFNLPYSSSNTMNIPSGLGNDTFNQNTQVYTVQIRELRNKIELLQEQKVSLIDKIRIYEKGNGFSNLNSQQTIQTYRQEINSLKIQISELSQLYNKGHQKNDTHEVQYLKQSVATLTETVKQYEEQLIQAQNHIIFLQNSRNGDDNAANLEAEVKYLRETIAKYTEHIEQLDIDRQKYEQLLQQKEQENNSLLHQYQESKNYIQSLEAHLEKIKNHPSEFNGVSYEIYNNLVAEYGRKTLQTIILMQQINRLNYRHTQIQNHLEKAEEYIIRLQESFEAQKGIAVQQHQTEINKANLDNEQLIQKINELQESLSQPSKQEKVGPTSTQNFMSHEEYEKLLRVLREREQESRLLSEEMKNLNEKYAETRDHLEKAEDYIIQLQESQQIQVVEGSETGRSKIFEQEISKLQMKITQLEHELTKQRKQKEGLSFRVTGFTSEYEDMQYRYKSALQSMGKRYDQLLQERNALTSKLSVVQSRLIESTNTVSQQQLEHLRLNISQLDQQLIQSRSHLKNAQIYIEENIKFWEQASVYKERHDQQIVFIQTIKRDLQISQRQTSELSTRLQHFEAVVSQLQTLRSENEQLTIVIREKDNTQVSSSLKQIDELQETLNNYVNLYQASVLEIKQVQQQNASLKVQSSKVSELHQHLLLAENHIIWQQQKLKSFDDFQSKNNDLKQHLMKAEEHILFLQDQLQKARQLISELQDVIKIYKHNQINVTLHKAEEYLQSHPSSQKSL